MSQIKVNEIKDLAGNSLIKKCEVEKVVDNLVGLLTVPTDAVKSVRVLNYHSDVEGGGGVFYWDADKDKDEHNGGTVIDPTVVYPTDWDNQTQLATWFDTANTGTGCWVRQYDDAVNVKWFGAKGDGSTDDTVSIQTCIDKSPVGSEIYFKEGTYDIYSEIFVNRRLTLKGANYHQTIIANKGTGNAISLNVQRIVMSDFFISGNNLSQSGLVLNESSINIYRVRSNGNGVNGLVISPNTWIINIYDSVFAFNGQDGIYAVSSGPNGQINIVNIVNSTLWLNGRNGATITGLSVNISGCTIEDNAVAGILGLCQDYTIYNMVIEKNYFENNPAGMVVFETYPSLGHMLHSVSFKGNYMYMNSSYASADAAFVKATTDTSGSGVRKFIFDSSNTILTDILPHIDLGNAAERNEGAYIETHRCGDTPNWDFFYKNIKDVSLSHYQKTMSLSGICLCSGITYDTPELSENIGNGSPTNVTAYYPIALENGSNIRKTGIYVETTSTNYAVVFSLLKMNPKTGATATIGLYSANLNRSGSRYIESLDIALMGNPENTRIKGNELFLLRVQITDSSGSPLKVGNPLITYL